MMQKIKFVISILVAVTIFSSLFGCSSTFKNINVACSEKENTLPAAKRIGVLMVAMEGTKKSTGVKERHLVGALKEIGLNAHTVEPTDQVRTFVRKYEEIYRTKAEGISTPCQAELGNLGKIFEDEGIDTLVIYDGTQEGEATVFGTLIGFADVATTIGMSVATKTVIPRSTPAKQTYNAVTANHISVITSDGKISRYVSIALPRQDEPLYESERVEIAQQIAGVLARKEEVPKL